MNNKAQGAIEYLLLLSGAVLVAALVISIMTGMGGMGVPTVNNAFNSAINGAGGGGTGGGAVCWNNVLEGDEECEGGGPYSILDCSDLWPEYSGGTATCDNCHWDKTNCISNPIGNGICGDSTVQCPNSTGLCETCDNSLPKNCSEIKGSLDWTGTATCYPSSSKDGCTWDVSGCTKISAGNCGNGAIDSGEQCDGTNFGTPAATCASLGFTGGGTLSCYPSSGVNGCHFNTTLCVQGGGGNVCGNGIVESPETCDPPGSKTDCTLIKFDYKKGEANCNAACSWDESKCSTEWIPDIVYPINETWGWMPYGVNLEWDKIGNSDPEYYAWNVDLPSPWGVWSGKIYGGGTTVHLGEEYWNAYAHVDGFYSWHVAGYSIMQGEWSEYGTVFRNTEPDFKSMGDNIYFCKTGGDPTIRWEIIDDAQDYVLHIIGNNENDFLTYKISYLDGYGAFSNYSCGATECWATLKQGPGTLLEVLPNGTYHIAMSSCHSAGVGPEFNKCTTTNDTVGSFKYQSKRKSPYKFLTICDTCNNQNKCP